MPGSRPSQYPRGGGRENEVSRGGYRVEGEGAVSPKAAERGQDATNPFESFNLKKTLSDVAYSTDAGIIAILSSCARRSWIMLEKQYITT